MAPIVDTDPLGMWASLILTPEDHKALIELDPSITERQSND